MSKRSEAKKKRINKLNEKPFADKLQGFPKLQKELRKIENQPHPLDTNCWLNTLLIGYARCYMDLSQKMVITQNCHHSLPKKDNVLEVRNRLGRQLYKESASDPDSDGYDKRDEFYDRVGSNQGLNFRMTPEINKRAMIAFMRAYWFDMTTIFVTTGIAGALNFGSVFATKEGLDLITTQLKDHNKIVEKEPILFYFGLVWFFGVLSAIYLNWLNILISRMSMRFFSGFTTLIFEKLLRVSMINPFEHGEGSILNYIQNDLMIFDSNMYMITQILYCCLNIPLSLGLGCYLFGYYFLIIIAGIMIVSYINALIMNRSVAIYNKWAQKTDSRLQLLKNVLANIKFIKIGVLENSFFMKLVKRRKEEMILRVIFLSFYGFLEFITSMGIAGIIMSFLLAYFVTDHKFTVGGATALLQIINLIKDSLKGIPGGLSSLISAWISSKRVGLFLRARELDAPAVYAKSDPSSLYALEIRNGFFYWDKKLSTEEAYELREAKIKSKKGKKKASKKIDDGNKRVKSAKSVASDSKVSNLRQTLLTVKSGQTGQTGLTDQEKDGKEKLFALENLNFKAERGKLTVIIGKIGSGKSSILNALMGEMRVSDPSRTSIHVNGTVSYQGQDPWLINGTIKDNVLLNKPYDEKKFNWALKYSALELDLKTWDLRELHEVGESGTALSGGQRARISLARCLYQE